MSFINSVTSGMNINLGNGFFNGNLNNVNNINVENNYDNNDDDNDNDNDNDNEDDNEDDEDDIFIQKRNQFILELDEFQFKHLKKYSALKEDNCAICLQKYKKADIIKEFPFKHIFHKNCIFRWLKKSNVCPLCKYDITNDVNKVILREEEDE